MLTITFSVKTNAVVFRKDKFVRNQCDYLPMRSISAENPGWISNKIIRFKQTTPFTDSFALKMISLLVQNYQLSVYTLSCTTQQRLVLRSHDFVTQTMGSQRHVYAHFEHTVVVGSINKIQIFRTKLVELRQKRFSSTTTSICKRPKKIVTVVITINRFRPTILGFFCQFIEPKSKNTNSK